MIIYRILESIIFHKELCSTFHGAGGATKTTFFPELIIFSHILHDLWQFLAIQGPYLCVGVQNPSPFHPSHFSYSLTQHEQLVLQCRIMYCT